MRSAPPRARHRVAAWVAAVLCVVVAGCASTFGTTTSTSSPPSLEPVASPVLDAPTAQDAGSIDRAGLPTLAPPEVLDRVPTRVRIEALDIDLPVIAPEVSVNDFPYCDVAEFIPNVSRPGFPGTTFIYAHARVGMFLPILERSRVNDGASLIGMRVEVWTSDDRRFEYDVSQVMRHVTTLDFAFGSTAEQLILQTSEGPHGTPGKTMLVATPVANEAAAHSDAHPTPHPLACS